MQKAQDVEVQEIAEVEVLELNDQVTLTVVRNPQYLDGESCPHPGCLSHISHPCEGCGRIGGRYHHEVTS